MTYTPLRGLTVLDVSEGVAGPYCTKLMSDLGARVVKVEQPGVGDPARDSAIFPYLNAGKRFVAIDATEDSGREAILGLAASADVMVESFEPGTIAGWGLGFEGLRERNPHLVLTSISNFGQDGVYSGHHATELVMQSLGGFVGRTGYSDREPVAMSLPLAQYVGGLTAYIATVALLGDDRADRAGDWIDVSIFESLLSIQDPFLTQYAYSGIQRRRDGAPGSLLGQANGRPDVYPKGVMKCRDGYVYPFVTSQQHWVDFCQMLGRPEWAEDTRFESGRSRLEHAAEIDAALEKWLMERDAAEIYLDAQRRRIPFGYLPLPADLLASLHLNERNFFRDVVTEEGEVLRVPGLPFRPVDLPAAASAPVAGVGAHNDEVLSGLRLDIHDRPMTRRLMDVRPPLDGFRILDLTHIWAGPKATQILSYLGAEVIKVEAPGGRPDSARGGSWPSFTPGYPDSDPGHQPYNRAALFNTSNRRKRAITLDLKTDHGHKVLERLVAVSDVIVENFSAGVLNRLGFDYATLRELNSRIIRLSMPGFGSSGPERAHISYAPVIASTAGLLNLVSYPDGRPIDEGMGIPDPVAGLFGAAAIVTARHARARTDTSCNLEISQQEALLSFNAEGFVVCQRNAVVAEHPSIAPQGIYETSEDGAWLAISAQDDLAWQALCTVIGRDDLGTDEGLATASARRRQEAVVDAAVTAWTRLHTASKGAQLLQAAGIAAGAVLDDAALSSDSHLRQRGFFETVRHPEAGEHDYPVPLGAKFGAHAVTAPAPAPLFGEHSDVIFEELLGMSAAQIAALHETGVTTEEPGQAH